MSGSPIIGEQRFFLYTDRVLQKFVFQKYLHEY